MSAFHACAAWCRRKAAWLVGAGLLAAGLGGLVFGLIPWLARTQSPGRYDVISDCVLRQDWGGTLKEADRLLKDKSADAQTMYWRGLANLKSGNYDQAIADIDAALRTDDKLRDASEQQQPETPIPGRLLTSELVLRQDLADAYEACGNNALQQARQAAPPDRSQFDAAIDDFTKAINNERIALESYGDRNIGQLLSVRRGHCYENRGIAWAAKGFPNLAADDFERALLADPENTGLLVHYAEAALASGNWPRALVAGRRAVSREIDNRAVAARAFQVLGRANMASINEDISAAIACYREAVRLDDRLAASVGNDLQHVYDRAVAKGVELPGEITLSTGVAKQPTSGADSVPPPRIVSPQKKAEEFAEQGTIAYNERRYQAAVDNFAEAIRLNPRKAENFFSRGLAFLQNREPGEAVQDFNQAIALNRDYAAAIFARGQADATMRRWHLAIDDFTQAARLTPNRAEIYYDRGRSYLELERFDRAIADLELALRLGYDQPPLLELSLLHAHHRRGEAELAAGQWAAARGDFEQARSLRDRCMAPGALSAELVAEVPSDTLLVAHLAEAIRAEALATVPLQARPQDKQRLQSAEAFLQAAVRLQPGDPQNHVVAGELCLRQAGWQQAIDQFNAAVRANAALAAKLRPRLTEAYRGRAAELDEQDKPQEALQALEVAMGLAPTDGQNFVLRGRIYARLKKLSLARNDLQTAMRIAPELAPQVLRQIEALPPATKTE